jgi:hypothetical protein
MATLSQSARPQANATRARVTGYAPGGVRFDLTVALLNAWFMIGLYVDGWAHGNGLSDETFFTPWHALLYSGVAATGAFLVITQARNVSKGYAWSRALPKGYLLSLIGVVLFAFGGGFDLLWHTLFGFEADIEALLSPAHLFLATAGVMIMSGPLRAVWNRKPDLPGWRGLAPAIIELLLLMSLGTFFTQYSNVFIKSRLLVDRPLLDSYYWDVSGVSHFIIPAAIQMFILLLAIRRWTLPFGAVTFMLTANAIGMFLMQVGLQLPFTATLLAPIAAGLIGDVLILRLNPSIERTTALRVFAFVVPFALYAFVFGILLLQHDIDWRIHMWLGVSITTGVIGLGLSFLLAPPAIPADE